MVEFCIALIRFALELANCNCLPLKPLGNVLTTSPQFDSPVYTAWLYPGAAVWCHETKHAVLSFSFFSLLAANSKPSLKWAYCIAALAKSMTVELNQAQRELDQEEKYSPLSFHLTNQTLPSATSLRPVRPSSTPSSSSSSAGGQVLLTRANQASSPPQILCHHDREMFFSFPLYTWPYIFSPLSLLIENCEEGGSRTATDQAEVSSEGAPASHTTSAPLRWRRGRGQAIHRNVEIKFKRKASGRTRIQSLRPVDRPDPHTGDLYRRLLMYCDAERSCQRNVLHLITVTWQRGEERGNNKESQSFRWALISMNQR